MKDQNHQIGLDPGHRLMVGGVRKPMSIETPRDLIKVSRAQFHHATDRQTRKAKLAKYSNALSDSSGTSTQSPMQKYYKAYLDE